VKSLFIPLYNIFIKDAHSELRTRYALNALFMFVVTALSIILFSLGSESISQDVLAGILWVIIFFSSMSGLSRTFVSEEERGTVLTLQLIAPPTPIFLGKLLFNGILTLALNTVIAILYILLINNFVIASSDIFWTTIFLGSLAIASSSTIIAAIIAKANTKGTLYPVLSFPIMLPMLITVIKATQLSLEGAFFTEAFGEFQILISYTVVIITVSIVLFEFVWKD
jgi:heme exporter protein B